MKDRWSEPPTQWFHEAQSEKRSEGLMARELNQIFLINNIDEAGIDEDQLRDE